MATVCLATFDADGTGGPFAQHQVSGNAILNLIAIFQNTTTGKMDIIGDIPVEIPTGSSLPTVRTLITDALVARAATYGYTLPRGNCVIPTIQSGA